MLDNFHRARLTLTAFIIVALALAVAQSRVQADSPDTKGNHDDGPPLRLLHFKGTGYKGAAATPHSKNGEKLFTNLNCVACHAIHNVGGSIAPFLDGIGGRRSKEYLEAKLGNTAEAQKRYHSLTQGASERFEHNRISKESAEAIVSYLLTIPDPAGGYVVEGHTRIAADEPEINKSFKPAVKTATSADGAKLYNDLGCIACHSIGGTGGWMGPALDGIGGRRTSEYMTAHIADARAHSLKTAPNGFEVVSSMPNLKATPEQIHKIVTFLRTLPNRDK